MVPPIRRTTLPAAALLLLLTAGCGSSDAADPAASTPGGSATSPTAPASSGVPSIPTPPSSTGPGGADQGQCPVTPEELQATTKLTWKLRRTLPEQPWMLDKSIKVSTCLYTADAKAVTDSYGQPLILRLDIGTGANAAALEKSNLEGCGEGLPPGTMRAPRGGGSGKVCDVGGSVEAATVVKDGTTLSFTMFSDSEKILKDFSPKFEAAVAAIAG